MKELYVTDYAETTPHGITVCNINEFGSLEKLKLIETRGYVTNMVKRDNRFYAVTKPDNNYSGGLLVYENEQLIDQIEIKEMSFTHCCLDSDGKYLYAISYHQNKIYSFAVENGIRIVSDIELSGSSVNPNRQMKSFPHYVGITPDKNYIYYVDLGADKIRFYHSVEGQLSFEWEYDIVPGSGPRQLIFSETNNYCYLVNEISNTVQVFAYQKGTLTLLQTVSSIPVSFSGVSHTAAIKLVGEYLYVSNRGHDSVACYRVNPDIGLLWFEKYIMTAKEPRDILIVDSFLLVACQNSGLVESIGLGDEELTTKIDELMIENPVHLCI